MKKWFIGCEHSLLALCGLSQLGLVEATLLGLVGQVFNHSLEQVASQQSLLVILRHVFLYSIKQGALEQIHKKAVSPSKTID